MLFPALLLQAATVAPPPVMPPLHGGPAPLTCPVGGERFSAWRPTMFSTYGARPDGKPYSYLPMPFPIPECPGNRLLMFDDFTPAEVARLPALIAGTTYRRMIDRETPFFRAAWLAGALGRPQAERLYLLLTATWETTPGELAPADTAANRKLAARNQRAFAEAVEKARPRLPADQRSGLEARAANAWRELARFDRAEKTRRRALADLTDKAREQTWDKFLASLGAVIARRDSSPEPLDMIPEREAAGRCEHKPATTTFDRDFCARRKADERPARPAPAG